MEGEIKKYIDSVIPKNIPEKRKLLLSDELESHIYDKVDRYEEIGYTTEQSIKKALEEMGEGEEVKKSISDGFDKLYHEKTWWAVSVGVGIVVLNSLFFLDFVTAYFGHGDIMLGGVISSLVCLAVIVVTAFVIKKQYENMIVSIAISHFITGISIISYPFASFLYAFKNIAFLSDYFGSSRMPDFTFSDKVFGIAVICSMAYSLLFAVVCLVNVQSLYTHKKVLGVLSKTAVAVAFVLTLANCIVSPVADNYETEYYNNYYYEEVIPTKENIELFKKTAKIKKYDDAVKLLKENGYTSKEEYRKSLDKNDQKKFDYSVEHIYAFDNSYEVWFDSDSLINSDGFNNIIFLKKDTDDNIKSVAVGRDPEMEISYENTYDLDMYIADESSPKAKNCLSDFKNLKKGDSEKDVMSIFGKEYGIIYSYITNHYNDSTENIYRIYVHYTNGDYLEESYVSEEYYIKLVFEGGVLDRGTLYLEPGYAYDDEGNYEKLPPTTITIN